MKASIFPKWSYRVGSQIVTSVVGKICHALSRLTFRVQGCSSPTQDIAGAARDANMIGIRQIETRHIYRRDGLVLSRAIVS